MRPEASSTRTVGLAATATALLALAAMSTAVSSWPGPRQAGPRMGPSEAPGVRAVAAVVAAVARDLLATEGSGVAMPAFASWGDCGAAEGCAAAPPVEGALRRRLLLGERLLDLPPPTC